jgi:azurin
MMGFYLYRLGKLADMTRRDLLAGLLAAPAFAGYRAIAASGQRLEVSLKIATDGDLLAFKPTELTCATGSLVHLTFFHAGKYISQEHNWVLTRPGAADAVAQTVLAAGDAGGYVPHGDARVIAATKMCGKGEHVSVDFIAPAQGDYPFICTYPGHAAFMHGTLHVTPR